MRITVKCHHLYIDGKRVEKNSEIDIDEAMANNILLSDKEAKRAPRIVILEQPKPIKARTNGKNKPKIH